MNLLCARCVHFIVLSRRRDTILPEGTGVHSGAYSSKRFEPLSNIIYDYAKVIDELEKTKTRNLAVLRCFWFQ